MADKDPESLARRFEAGDVAATEEVRGRVRRIVAFRGYGMSREDRVDVEQAALLQIWRGIGRPGFESSGFWGFVEVVTSRRCVDWLRSQRPERQAELPEHVASGELGALSTMLRRERQALVRTALESLPEPCRRLIELHYRDGRSYTEIAEIMGKSSGALRVQMHRCVRLAARTLSEAAPAGDPKKKPSEV